MGNRYVVSDLHGQLDLYNQIKEYVNDDDIIYALGDFGDRGPEPWLTLKAALDDEQIVYLMGNHDLMLIEYMNMIFRVARKYEDWSWNVDEIPYNPNLPLTYNGGWETVCGWCKEPNRMEYYEKLLNTPLEIRLAKKNWVNFIFLTHAGYTPGRSYPVNVEGFVWDRYHYTHEGNLGKDLLIFGHSPIKYIKEDIDRINDFIKEPESKIFYEERDGCLYLEGGTKICIDRGAHFTGETVLLNIDTLESKVFKTEQRAEGVY